METNQEKLSFASDYMRGAHPAVMQALVETNMEKTGGYGLDPYCHEAAVRIRAAMKSPTAEVMFLTGGTQTNAVAIEGLLDDYQGVVCAATGHINTHEAGAIEAAGHKVLPIPHRNGKISAKKLREYLSDFSEDETHFHMVMPGLVYISQPTEYGTLYSLKDLKAIRKVCNEFGIRLYLDGARLAYALACSKNDVTLKDIADLCDAFYIGGTKCGALFGEALVTPNPDEIPHLFTRVKRQGALLAKGRVLGVQFSTLFTDDLYETIGLPAVREADRIRAALKEKGYELCFDSPTNQIFFVMENEKLKEFGAKVEYSFWEKYDESHTVIRLATDWAATAEETDQLIALL